ncbi:hypothetical protein F0562_031172 [Nyssa sinensis]|uniref:TMEM62 C-terminal domain-containing protein n=1 Tax=Nyssa sinensis TaxID=561372 RepID=A0A5J5ASZ4_9ASTE|nr:hypothetical protein F0562_031172 [Nyssa sinensis]
MVVILPHLFFVVFPAILVTGSLAAERGMYQEHFLTLSGKKEDDFVMENTKFQIYEYVGNSRLKFCLELQNSHESF